MKNPIKGIIKYNNERQGGICGQGFTEYLCIGCNEKKNHPTTCTPILCPTCIEELKKISDKLGYRFL
tara:strand:+ start:22550 stop:22750 length:201 start_codon:yes stop_codon:yes gene_type:complete